MIRAPNSKCEFAILQIFAKPKSLVEIFFSHSLHFAENQIFWHSLNLACKLPQIGFKIHGAVERVLEWSGPI